VIGVGQPWLRHRGAGAWEAWAFFGPSGGGDARPIVVPSAFAGIRNPSQKAPRRRHSLGWRQGCLPGQGGEEQTDHTHLLLVSA
jgi:hypothetical protein